MHSDPMSRTRRRMRLALSWLVVGAATLLLTPVPMYTRTLGWSPLIWLVLAPAVLLLVLKPRRPATVAHPRWCRFAQPAHAVPVRQRVRPRMMRARMQTR